MSFDAPVVLFIFNHPEMTRRVFAAIREAKPSKLLVVSDGPRDRPGEAALCAETRVVFDAIDWECELHTNFADANMGVPRRFASAFAWILDLVDEAIILEHDCLPHPTFFPFCAELLERYRDNPRVMWIGGTNPLPKMFGDASYFFARTNWVWGWATWKRAWQHFDIDVRDYPEFLRSGRIAQISRYRPLQRGYMAMFERAYAGEWVNWDVQATFTVWNNDGLCVKAQCTPSRSAILTGRYSVRSGTYTVPWPGQGETGLAPWEYTTAKLLSDAGYATALMRVALTVAADGRWTVAWPQRTHRGGEPRYAAWPTPANCEHWRPGCGSVVEVSRKALVYPLPQRLGDACPYGKTLSRAPVDAVLAHADR